MRQTPAPDETAIGNRAMMTCDHAKSRNRSNRHAIEPSGMRAGVGSQCIGIRERAVADGSDLVEKNFWIDTPQQVSAALGCALDGLSSGAAKERLDRCGPNSDAAAKTDSVLRAVLRRLLEPLSLILLAAGIV